jgi:hypothetical protein
MPVQKPRPFMVVLPDTRWWALCCAAAFLFVTAGCSSDASLDRTPTNTPTPTQPPPGLGIDRETLIDLFDDDFAFTPPSTTDDGSPIVEGQTTLGQEGIGFIGPPENLTKVFHGAVPEFVDPNEQGFQNLRRAMLLLVIVPEWEDASDWMTSQFHTLGPGDSESVEIAGKRITMDRLDHEGVAVYGLQITAIR